MAIYYAGQPRNRSLPRPGEAVQHLFAVRLLWLILQRPVDYAEIAEFIETRSPTVLNLRTEADLGIPEFRDGLNEEIAPECFAERGLWSTIDIGTLNDCIERADRLSGSKDDHAALEIIRYDIRFDAWPETPQRTGSAARR